MSAPVSPSTPEATRLPRRAHLLRAIGVLIVVAGVIDPGLTRVRATRPTVAVVSEDSVAQAALLGRVREALSSAVTVTGATHPQDAARVVVGASVPIAPDTDTRGADAPVVPTFVVLPHVIGVGALSLPPRVPLASRTPVAATLTRSTGRGVAAVQLRAGAVILAEDTVTLDAATPSTVSLPWVPSTVGTQALEFLAIDVSTTDTTRVLRAVSVDSTRWRVLTYDARPSYLATFVRRALERDPRFAVQTRVVTASGPQQRITRGSARAPSSLATLDPSGVDVIVVGAPEALRAAEVEVLARAMRERGVSVVLLPDKAAGGPIDALVGSGGWRSLSVREAARIVAVSSARDTMGGAARVPRVADSVLWRASSVGRPVRLAPDAEPLLMLADGSEAPIVWRQPMGAGELLVSGAFDAWRTRDPSQSTFEGTWRDLIAASAVRRAPSLVAAPEQLVLAPGEPVALTVTMRAGGVAPLVTVLEDGTGEPALGQAVYPTDAPGQWLATVRAPAVAGAYQVTVTAGADRSVVPLVVRDQPNRGLADPPALVAAWTRARGGRELPAGELGLLRGAVLTANRVAAEALPWHPMRSPWWIVPLTLALAGDWWLRRRRGWR